MATREPHPRRQTERSAIYGRERERLRLRDILDDAIAGRGSLVLISGEAGIGKTTLVQNLIHTARERDCLVLSGGCYDLTTTPPYGPWIEVLRDYPADDDLPAVPEQLREGTSLEGIHSQTALFDLTSRFFQQAASTRPAVLLLEDLHWADAGSLELLRFLARSVSSHRILLLATYRDDEITRRDPLFQLIPVLARESEAVRIELRGWTIDEIRTILARRYDLAEADRERLAVYLEERAAGNPLFVVELLRTLESESLLEPATDGWCVGNLDGVPVPTFVVQLIESRMASLDSADRRLLEIAAVIGQEFSLDIWERASQAPSDLLSATLERSINAGILEEMPGGSNVRFHHALIREALYGEIGLFQRRDLHRVIADILIESPRPDPDEVITQLQPANDPRLADWLIRSGDRAMSRFAWDTAVERYTRASSLFELQEKSDPLQVCEVLLKLGDAQNHAGSGRGKAWGAGNDAEAQATFWRVAAIARRAGLPEQLARAALGIAGSSRASAHGGPEGVRLMAEALEALSEEDSVLRAQLLGRLATGTLNLVAVGRLTESASVEEVDVWSLEAVAMARRLGDPQALVQALLSRNIVIGFVDFEERHANQEEGLAAANQAGDHPLLAWLLYNGIVDLMLKGELEDARKAFADFEDITKRLRMPILDWFAAVHRSGELLASGSFEHTKRAIEQIDAVWPGSAAALAQRVALNRELGDVEAMRQSMFTGPSPVLSLATRLLYLLESGDISAARNHAEEFIDSGYLARPLSQRSIVWLRIAAIAAETCAAMDDEQRSATVYELLLPYSGLNIFAGYAQYSMGAVDHYLGLLAATMRDWDSAEPHFASALALNERWEFVPAAAYTRYAWAGMLHQRNGAGDRAQASELLAQALAAARKLGMIRLTRLAGELQRELVIDTQSHPAGLSDREVEVLEQAATGMTNAEIGEALFISPRTVAQHLRSVYNKLGVNSRTAAVSRWAELNSS
ncbi:AAA family ATPase [soil metagenome]